MEEICLRDKIGEFLCEFAKNDNRIYCLDSDLAKSFNKFFVLAKIPGL